MNSLSLSTIFNSDILSDCTLDLVDENSITTLNVHKIILYLGCPYFRSMFGEFKESNQSKITLEVPNVQATCDIIQSFYGTKIINSNNNWEYELNLFMCKRFFCIDTNFPHQIKIPSDEFEEFLVMIEKIGFNQDIKKFIIKNIPESYDFDKLSDLINRLECDHNERVRLMAKNVSKPCDFEKLSTNFIKDLWKIVDTYYIILISFFEINIINPEGTIHRSIKSFYEIKDVCYFEDKHLIAYHTNKNIYVYDIELDECIFQKYFSSDSEFMIKIYGDKLMIYKKNRKLKFYDINSGDLIKSLIFKTREVINIFIDEKENKLDILYNETEDKIISVYDLSTFRFLENKIWLNIYSFGCDYSIYEKSMIALYRNTLLFVLNYKGKGVCGRDKYNNSKNKSYGSGKKIYDGTSNIVGICWGHHGSIIYCCEHGTINIYDMSKNKLIKTIDTDYAIESMTKISNDRIMIKSGSELIEIDLDSGHELRNIDINSDVKSIMKISSGYDRLYELLPEP
ncbi:putative BTB/POZ domain-containing protein [Megavirus courdo11]|uniref:Putative BTB/POZ domain-containing protein n=1 Tax=Megavirus courdo11 TaxID=1128140 RepID=K7YAR3_9VIRU|nr:putative BTB/POZ domain-containing protein [Megavirus courdo11]